MTKVYLKSRQRAGASGSKVSYPFMIGKNNRFIHHYGKRVHKIREIASLTKMITSMTTIDFLNKYNYDPDKITYSIRKPSAMIGGTSAKL